MPADSAREALTAFAAGPWGQRIQIVAQRERHWPQTIPFFTFPPEVRRVIYTTNAIESLHMRLRKIIKSRSHLPSDEAVIKVLWLDSRTCTATPCTPRPPGTMP